MPQKIFMNWLNAERSTAFCSFDFLKSQCEFVRLKSVQNSIFNIIEKYSTGKWEFYNFEFKKRFRQKNEPKK